MFDGQSYTVRAFFNVSADPFRQQSAQPISVSGDPPSIRLVLVVR